MTTHFALLWNMLQTSFDRDHCTVHGENYVTIEMGQGLLKTKFPWIILTKLLFAAVTGGQQCYVGRQVTSNTAPWVHITFLGFARWCVFEQYHFAAAVSRRGETIRLDGDERHSKSWPIIKKFSLHLLQKLFLSKKFRCPEWIWQKSDRTGWDRASAWFIQILSWVLNRTAGPL